ncbi:RNA polymerase factor sigma-54, partial [Streptomyces albidochromogenes]|uniref:RNA polymerase factor sigma-54 n=1 Tax=Streptomyces albidochromogenes TaxID=329524 RepID=UPI001FCBB5CC
MLHRIQRFDPVGVAARTLGECLQLQLDVLPADTPGLALARQIAAGPLERLPRSGVSGLANELKQPLDEVETAVALLRSLDPRPGTQIAPLSQDTYVVPDVVVWRQNGIWRAALAANAGPKVVIHRGYEQLIRRCGEADAGYLRGQL